MHRVRSRYARRPVLIALSTLCLFLMTGFAASASHPAVKGKDKKSKNKNSNAPSQPGTPALWEDRGNIADLDLYWGIGSEEEMPKAPFQFDKEDVSGTNPKIKVIDANGVKWNLKFDEEVHAEVACSRLAWACGYMVEESYFFASGKVNGVTGLGRAKKFVSSDGSFTNGMFEKRPDDVARRAINWDWDRNPFSGSKEMSGLAILSVMLNNWDAKTTNNNVLGMFNEGGGVTDWYIVADWGGTLGKMGSFLSHSKWDSDAFKKQGFIDGVSGSSLKLNYSGKGGSIMKSVPVEHARWFAGIVGQLSDKQIREAFRAAGASDSETNAFASRIREKINELKRAVG